LINPANAVAAMNIFIIKISLVGFGNRELTWPLGCREPSHSSRKIKVSQLAEAFRHRFAVPKSSKNWDLAGFLGSRKVSESA
jgi:hypothetical protein